MNPRIHAILAELRRSPALPEIAEMLATEVILERQLRKKFYAGLDPSEAEKKEFIQGVVVEHEAPEKFALETAYNISQLLTPYVRFHKLGKVKLQKCLCAFPRNDYQPDLVFFKTEKSASFDGTMTKFPTPDLIVEVLEPATEARDRGVKFEDYASQGVQEYWMVNPKSRVVEQYLLNAEDTYELAMKAGCGEITSRVIHGLVAPVKAFFETGENMAAVQKLMGVSSVA